MFIQQIHICEHLLPSTNQREAMHTHINQNLNTLKKFRALICYQSYVSSPAIWCPFVHPQLNPVFDRSALMT